MNTTRGSPGGREGRQISQPVSRHETWVENVQNDPPHKRMAAISVHIETPHSPVKNLSIYLSRSTRCVLVRSVYVSRSSCQHASLLRLLVELPPPRRRKSRQEVNPNTAPLAPKGRRADSNIQTVLSRCTDWRQRARESERAGRRSSGGAR